MLFPRKCGHSFQCITGCTNDLVFWIAAHQVQTSIPGLGCKKFKYLVNMNVTTCFYSPNPKQLQGWPTGTVSLSNGKYVLAPPQSFFCHICGFLLSFFQLFLLLPALAPPSLLSSQGNHHGSCFSESLIIE